ncbi:bifunctional phosphopantothenoylcysteine decarboxylase/phosphopantothenate--cysteine ligase CoaBC [Chloroflexi bacterium TSY]|nr:bifunctional phosphopantothenoylcysteine decarboxylase/phosphopantothenate--cysteine ligase CoaBC [Chloroflexi bacterium TSY]
MIDHPLKKKKVVLGVTGSIACYKAADLASKLTQIGTSVDAILTRGACNFVTPLTFQSVTTRRAYTDDDLWGNEAHVLHVGLGHEADAILIAPATANTIARLAHGQSDNLLCLTAIAATCPLFLAPAMDGGMFTHPATQANLALLQQRGAILIGPAEGRLASGLVGQGRMSEPTEILGQLRYQLSRGGPLANRTIVITAGGTREALDPVRFLTNRSSGRQGFALAQAALDAGGNVILITSANDQPAPHGASLLSVTSAEEMADAVLAATETADALLMAAAVADFRPAQIAEHKIKKQDGIPSIELTPTPDILQSVAEQKDQMGKPDLLIGFAAESQNLLQNARDKLERKGLHFIVANDINATDAGFAVETNRVTILHRNGEVEKLPLMSKADVSMHIVQHVIDQLV